MNIPTLPNEEWRPVVGREDRYFVSNQGRLWSAVTNRLLKTQLNNRGYLSGSFFLNNTLIRVRVHRLVAIAFIPNPNNFPTVNHKNGIKADSRLENLEWASSKYQQWHKIKVLGLDGGTRSGAKLTMDQVNDIRARYQDGRIKIRTGKNYKQLAAEFGVHWLTIYDVVKKESWSDKKPGYRKPRKENPPSGLIARETGCGPTHGLARS